MRLWGGGVGVFIGSATDPKKVVTNGTTPVAFGDSKIFSLAILIAYQD